MIVEANGLMAMLRIMSTHQITPPGLTGPWYEPDQCPERGCTHIARRHRHKIPWPKVIRRVS